MMINEITLLKKYITHNGTAICTCDLSVGYSCDLCLTLTLIEKIEEETINIDELIKRYEHVHVNKNDGTDTCSECGFDLRNVIHRRISKESNAEK